MTDDSIVVSNGPTDDNPTYTPATDDVGGVHYQKVKLTDPTADSTTGIGIAANPMHVQGTVTASGGATAANQATEITSLATIASAIQTEDAGASTGDKGIASLGYVNTNAATLTSTEGDYGNFSINSKGAQHTDLNSDFRQSVIKSPVKVRDVATNAADAGMFVMGIRNSADATLTDADLDVSPIAVNLRGAVSVDLRKSMQATASGGDHLLKGEDAAHSSGDAGVFVLALRADTASSSAGTTGDYTSLNCDANGKLWVNAEITSQANTGTIATVAGSATSVTILDANASHKGRTIRNDSTAILYLRLASGSAVTTDPIKLFTDETLFIAPGEYSGIISGIWASATGNARVWEAV